MTCRKKTIHGIYTLWQLHKIYEFVSCGHRIYQFLFDKSIGTIAVYRDSLSALGWEPIKN